MSIVVKARPGDISGRLLLSAENGALRDLGLCMLGPAGIKQDKREGDQATPIGRFPLRQVYYRPDRVAKPKTSLPVVALAPDDGWCDAPADPAYNRHVKLPYAASHEELWREDHLYNLILVLGHNDAPVVPYHGSCIFLHLMRAPGTPTGGCVGVTEDMFREIVQSCGVDSFIEILAA